MSAGVLPEVDPPPSPEPTLQAARAALAAVDPQAYAGTRNHLQGAVTGLSPWITHGLLTVQECLRALGLPRSHKLVYEFGWREYFRHVWQHQGDGILRSLHAGPLPEDAYDREMPEDVVAADTGIPMVDQAVRRLHATGGLHNHARMWLASYLVHGRKLHWRTGADWMAGHLLDGDLASNHLSWQWVAGTGSHKPYVFDAANIERFAPHDWHSRGTAIDIPREDWEALARSARRLPAGTSAARRPGHGGGAAHEVPALRSRCPWGRAPTARDADGLAGADVWLAHPWSLGDPPPGCRVLTFVLDEAHDRQPWSALRWQWVGRRMQALGGELLCGSAEDLARLVAGAARVRGIADPHIARWLPARMEQSPEPRAFAPVDSFCPSFSKWWQRAELLPGILAG